MKHLKTKQQQNESQNRSITTQAKQDLSQLADQITNELCANLNRNVLEEHEQDKKRLAKKKDCKQ
jgi:hypothetical protein